MITAKYTRYFHGHEKIIGGRVDDHGDSGTKSPSIDKNGGIRGDAPSPEVVLRYQLAVLTDVVAERVEVGVGHGVGSAHEAKDVANVAEVVPKVGVVGVPASEEIGREVGDEDGTAAVRAGVDEGSGIAGAVYLE